MSDPQASPQCDPPINSAHPATTKSFYGWWIVLASTIILFVFSGIGFYGHGVILDTLRILHGWSKATISSAVTLLFFTSGITGLIIGRQIDRYGPRRFLTIGSVSGLAGVFTMCGAAFGPSMAGFIFDATGSYQAAFSIFAGISLAAILVIYFAKPPEPDKPVAA